MNMKIKISVRDLIEFILRTGDLVSSFVGSNRNVEAIKIHQKIQKNSGSNYKSEVSISYSVSKDCIHIEVNGRIDGVIIEGDKVTIDEIKTTVDDLDNITEDYNMLHWAQVKCYAYFYCIENKINIINIRLTYYHMESKEIKYLTKTYKLQVLEEFFEDIIDKYIYWAKLKQKFQQTRDLSIRKMVFPYKEYRIGQREMAVSVYTSIRENRNIFIKAPTGIGKTMSVIFPSCKALGEGIIAKIFYATSKNIIGDEVKKAFTILNKNGLKFKIIWITAKDKICFKEETNCNSEYCEYAKGHFDRVNDSLLDILNEDIITKEKIVLYAKKHRVCPFEFSLDLTNWCDCVVCDYNYIFDPNVYLKRFFAEGDNDYCILIDEAHNLIDRSRDMYSAELYKKEILNLKNKCKNISKKLYKILNKINYYLIDERKKCENNSLKISIDKSLPKGLISLLYEFIYNAEKFLKMGEDSNIQEEILDIYFKFNKFIKISELYSEKYVTYSEKSKDELLLKIFCIDTSELMRNFIKKVKSTVFFSATLTPMNYFMYLLGGDSSSYRIEIPSPFKKENLCVLLNDKISTKYNHRKDSYKDISHIINECISYKNGNYFVFFPSYEYMKDVFNTFCEQYVNCHVICQKNNMIEEEKNEFIKLFSEKNTDTLIGFVVMGGIFSEGIDLAGEKLSGVIIIGVGLPKISFERNLIKEYFDEHNKNKGFLYAYIYPGINKVLQSAGRVIRSENDRGIVVLVDERYSSITYKNLLPKEWSKINTLLSNKNNIIEAFWKNK